VLLVKPLTYMNLSGQAVAPLAKEYGLKPDRILVIADELDLPIGRLKMQPKGGAGGHNGQRSLIFSLGTQEYPRIRVGIGKVDRTETIDHVLGSFLPDERATVQALLKRIDEACRILVVDGLEKSITFANNE
jgi:PTH1 family peptidyl-tRNA hydrolase